jgi:hypothetical protein
MSYTEGLQELAAVEQELEQLWRRLDTQGEDPSRREAELAAVLEHLYRVHETLCAAEH